MLQYLLWSILRCIDRLWSILRCINRLWSYKWLRNILIRNIRFVNWILNNNRWWLRSIYIRHCYCWFCDNSRWLNWLIFYLSLYIKKLLMNMLLSYIVNWGLINWLGYLLNLIHYLSIRSNNTSLNWYILNSSLN